jgi:hypothetical protein
VHGQQDASDVPLFAGQFGDPGGARMAADRATEDAGRSAGPRVPVNHLIVRKGRNAAHAVLDRETVLVTLMAIAIALSAFSVWQATRASDEADEVGAQARVVQADTIRDSSYLQTLVDHDLNVLKLYCASLLERDVAVASLFSDDRPDVSGVVAGDLTLRALRPLLRGYEPDEPCPDAQLAASGDRRGYSALAAQQSGGALGRASELWGPEVGQAARLTARAATLSSQERWLMTAGLVFAVALLGLIMIDVLLDRSKRPAGLRDRTVRRWQHWSLAVATAGLLLGAAILATMGDPPYLLGMGVVLALVIAARTKAKVPRAVAGFLRFSGGSSGQPHWWAEILGAFTLVVFSASALGLSYVTVREREARAQSERQQAASQQLLQAGEQDALRDLAAVAQLAILDSQVAAANQEQALEEANAISARRVVVAERVQAIEESVRDELTHLPSSGSKADCPFERNKARPASDLLEEGRERPQAFAEYVSAHQEAARACDILSALTRNNATGWASRASVFTVALVILGLAGFLLALASDPDRSQHSARWLLWVGALGMLLGLAVALTVPLRAWGDSQLTESAARVEFSKEVAAGQQGACDSAIGRLDRAIARSDTYGPAFAARATTRLCSAAVMPHGAAISSEVPNTAVPLIVKDLRKAAQLGPVTPTLTGDLARALILNGLREGPQAEFDLGKGLQDSRTAIKGLEENWKVLQENSSKVIEENLSPTRAIHRMRFNVALAHAALDDREAAQRAYYRAVECLDPDHRCPGGGLADDEWRGEEALSALADLELVAGPTAMDRYWEIIVSGFNPQAPAGQEWSGAQLDIYAHEVQVSKGVGSPPESAVIWYHRPNDKMAWGILQGPSLKTLHVGDNLNRPISADQLLLAGDYRADIYAGGKKRASLVQTNDLPAAPYSRRSSPELRVSVVAPTAWTPQAETTGVDWSLGPSPSSGVAVRRKEGVTPNADVDTFLLGQLEQWMTERFGRDVTGKGRPADDQYLLGMTYPLVRTYEDLNVTAAAALTPYASSPACGGTMIMAISGGTDVSPEDVTSVFHSLVLDEPLTKTPLIENPYESDHFSITIPEGWDASHPPRGTGNEFNAEHCETGTNVIVNHEPRNGQTVDSSTSASLKEYRQPDEFPKFKLHSQHPTKVPGSIEAVELVFTWHSENGPVWQRQVYAADETTLLWLTFTTHRDNFGRFKKDAERIVKSLQLRPG